MKEIKRQVVKEVKEQRVENIPQNPYWVTDEVSNVRLLWINQPKQNAETALYNLSSSETKYCYASLSWDQTIPTASWVNIDFDLYSTNDDWMSVTNGRVTITEDWQYIITASIEWDDATGTADVKWFLNINWTQIVRDVREKPNTLSVTHLISHIVSLEVWDYIELSVYHNFWSNLDVNWTTWKYTLLSVIKY